MISQHEPAGETELVVEITAPDGMSKEVVMQNIKDFVLAMNEFHHALGGNGLEIVSFEWMKE